MPLTGPRRRFPLPFALAAALAVTAVAPARAVDGAGATPPVLHGRSSILLEAATGSVLYEHNADEAIAPASLTKLMTLHVALAEIDAGRLSRSDVVIPGPEAWARNMPAGSSVMYLGPNQKLTVGELLEGLVVDSGNDAAVALAYRIAGSVPAFAALMNGEAERLGFRVMYFVEPSGISPFNMATAREYAEFCRIFISLHPETLKTLFSRREFTYPLAANLTGGNNESPVTQTNRNLLLGRYEGLDGLKTGHIDEAGYHMAATAKRDGMRLISVILGVPDLGRVSGEQLRAQDSAALLDYGFGAFTLLSPAFSEPQPVRIWKGSERHLVPRVLSRPLVAVRRTEADGVRTAIEQVREVVAPVGFSQVLGHVVVSRNGVELGRFELVAGVDVAPGGLPRRAWDSVILFFRRLFGVTE